MKSITRQKHYEEILQQLQGYNNVFLVGCGTCPTLLQTGGIEEVASMKDSLQESGYAVTGSTVIPTACDDMTSAVAEENAEAIQNADVIMVMACALGVQRQSMSLEKIVMPALDTLFLGLEEQPGYFKEACDQCGQCILGYTAGVCPITACHKGLVNGPCGGTNRGKCEVDSERDCAFTLIYNKLKEQGREDLMKIYHGPRDSQVAPRPRVKILDTKEK